MVLVGMSLPMVIAAFLPPLLQPDATLKLRDLSQSPPVSEILSIAVNDLRLDVSLRVTQVLFMIFTYTCLVVLCSRYLRGQGLGTLYQNLRSGLRLGLRSVLWIWLISVIILHLVEQLFPVALFTIMPLFFASALAVLYESGVWKSIVRSLMVQYRPGSRFQFQLYVQAGGLGALIFIIEKICIAPRYWMSSESSWSWLQLQLWDGYPLIMKYVLIEAAMISLQSLSLFFFAIITVSFVHFQDLKHFESRTV